MNFPDSSSESGLNVARPVLTGTKSAFGREKEAQRLADALSSALLGRSEIVCIRGESGIGKTTLVDSLKPMFRSKGMFGTGKFEPRDQGEPRHLLMEVFRGMLRKLLGLRGPELAKPRAALLNALGDLGGVLMPFLPDLFHIIGPQNVPPDLEPAEAKNRLHYLFGRFLNVLGEREPLILFLDDLQWADAATFALLEAWLRAGQPAGGLLLIAAFRNTPTEGLSRFLSKLDAMGKPPAYLDIAPLDAESIHDWVESAFAGDGDANRNLGNALFRGTRGNPYHIHQYLEALRRHRYARYDAATDKWALDFEGAPLPEDVSPSRHLLSLTLSELSVKAREALEAAACAGFVFAPGRIAALQGCTASELTLWLDECLKLGLIKMPYSESGGNPDTASYAFSHDQVQEALLDGLAPDRRRAIHFALGMALLDIPVEPDDALFDICGHLNRAHDLLADEVLRKRVAGLNLLAALKSKGASAFGEANRYCKAGIALLPPEVWKSDYQLALDLHLNDAETANLLHRYKDMEATVGIIDLNAKPGLDVLSAKEIRLQGLASDHRFKDTVDLGLDMLGELGVRFPGKPKKSHVVKAVVGSRIALFQRSFAELESQQVDEDDTTLMMSRIMSHMSSAVYLRRPDLHPLLLLAQFRHSLKYGFNPFTPFVYGLYGIILCDKLGKFDETQRYAKLALDMSLRRRVTESRAKVLFIVNHFLLPWKLSLPETFAGIEEGIAVGMKSGDFIFAGYLHNVLGEAQFHAGMGLQELHGILLQQRSEIVSIHQERCLLLQDLYIFAVDSLLGTVPGDAAEAESKRLHQGLLDAKDKHALALRELIRLILAVHSGSTAAALKAGRKVRKRLESFTGLFFKGWYFFYEGLALAGSEAWGVKEVAVFKANLAKLRIYARHAPANYERKVRLLEAEWHRRNGESRAAREAYCLAVESSRKAKDLCEESLAWERLFRFDLERGETAFAETHLREYLGCLRRWGAWPRAAEWATRYLPVFPNACRAPEVLGGGSAEFKRILAVAHQISSEMDLDALIRTLLEAIIELSGAQRACLVAEVKDGFEIKAQKRAQGNGSTADGTAVLRDGIPDTILRFASRTGRPLNLADAGANEEFRDDPFFGANPCKSVLCVPLRSQGQTEAFLYLENSATAGAFTKDDPWIEWLGGQAAISLRNAQLHRHRMTALKARINPHFLFNVLASISGLITSNPKASQKAIAKLGKLYRYHLENSDEELITLDRELALVDDYLAIEKLRFGNRLNVNRYMDLDLGGILVPPMSLQPLVENAVKHGLEPNAGICTITLKIRVQGDGIRISIHNNGAWGRGKPGTGEGAANIRERLRLAYGNRADLDFATQEGVEAIILIPRRTGASS